MRQVPFTTLALMLLLLASCQRSSNEPPEAVEEAAAAKAKIAAIAASSTASGRTTLSAADNEPLRQGAEDATAKLESATVSAAPSTGTEMASETDLSVHPIDRIAEGKRYRTATSALDRGDFATAETIRQELSTSPQYGSLATAIQALIWIKQGKFEEAIKLAEDISAIEVMQAESYVLAGEIFLRENRLAEATNVFREALARNPQHARAHRWLGVLYYDTGAMRLATNELRAAAESDQEDVNSLLLSGKILQDYEQYDDALRDFQLALQRARTDEAKVLITIRVAECLCKLRRLDEAEKVLADSPPLPGVLATRAEIAESTGNFEQAVKFAEQAIELAPNHRAASLVLARVYVTDRKWDLALPLVESLIKQFPSEHEPHLLYGRALVGSGDRDGGEREIGLANDLKETFFKFSDLHQTAIRNPQDTAVRLELALAAEKLGKTQLAVSWYKAVQGLDPGNRDAAKALERLSPPP